MKNKIKTYSFDLQPPKNFVNKYLTVKAASKKIAKGLLLEEMAKLNKKMIVVKEFDETKRELKK
jgi:hypothetical protein